VIDGKYRVEGMLGRGGMGVVLAAQHIELGHKVAIKVSFQQEPTAQARFLREARLAAGLTSENIARVHDVGRLAKGAPYLVMELLHGEDLGDVLDRGPVPVDDAVMYVLQACVGLREAHGRGIVHRDLKPRNLFVTKRTDGTPLVKVLDFGVSKLLSGDTDSLDMTLTTTETLVGSPAYMSPEQLRDSKDVDARADIWSLGVILHQLVTGSMPFIATSFSSLVLSVADTIPPAPSSLVPGVPEWFDAIVARCLAKRREDRFQSVDELVQALKRTISVTAPRAPKKRRTPISSIVFAFAAGSVVAVAIAVVFGSKFRAQQTPQAAPSPTASAPIATSAAATTIPVAATTTAALPSASVVPTMTARPKPSASASGSAKRIKPLGPTDTPE
jgi:serine/threonine-protein kinase